MTHAHDQFDGTALAGHVENLIHRRQQRRVAFEGESFVAQVALLERQLKQVGAQEQVEGAVLVDDGCGWFGGNLNALLNPAAALGVGDVHELNADAAAIDAARFPRPLVVDLKVGMRLRREEAERVQFGLEISKLPEQAEYAFPFVIFNDLGSCAPGGIPS